MFGRHQVIDKYNRGRDKSFCFVSACTLHARSRCVRKTNGCQYTTRQNIVEKNHSLCECESVYATETQFVSFGDIRVKSMLFVSFDYILEMHFFFRRHTRDTNSCSLFPSITYPREILDAQFIVCSFGISDRSICGDFRFPKTFLLIIFQLRMKNSDTTLCCSGGRINSSRMMSLNDRNRNK